MALLMLTMVSHRPSTFCRPGILDGRLPSALLSCPRGSLSPTDFPASSRPQFSRRLKVPWGRWVAVALPCLDCLGAFFAIIALFLLPDYPHSKTGSAMWTMSEDLRKIAQARIVADRVSETEIKTSIWRGLKLTVCDYKMWLLVSVNISISAAFSAPTPSSRPG
jgi:hypothetical protein